MEPTPLPHSGMLKLNVTPFLPPPKNTTQNPTSGRKNLRLKSDMRVGAVHAKVRNESNGRQAGGGMV